MKTALRATELHNGNRVCRDETHLL